MFYLAGIVITCFLLLILITKKNKTTADKILATWLLVTGIHLAFFYIFINNIILQWPLLLGIQIPLPLLHGPFLFLYTAALTNQLSSRKWVWLHFVPVAMAYLLMLPFFLLPDSKKIWVFKNEGAGYEQTTAIIFIAILLSGLLYAIWSFKKLQQHRKNINNQFSNTEKITLNWLQYLVAGISIIWITVWVGEDTLIYTVVVLYVIFIGYFGIKQVGIFTYRQPQEMTLSIQPMPDVTTSQEPITEVVAAANEPGTIAEKIKYQKSALSPGQMQAIHQQLSRLMQQEKLYKNPELTLAEVSQQLQVHPNILSQVINSAEQKSFFDYVNQLRVEEFKQLSAQPNSQQYTLLSLAFECGFNSKTAFNRNFKKVTGLSPSDYIKQQPTL